MSKHSQGERITAANHEKYNDGAEVSGYLQKPHHRRRIDAGVALLSHHLSMQFEELNPQNLNVLELAASTALASSLLRKQSFCTIASDFTLTPLKAIIDDSIRRVVFDASAPMPLRSGALHGLFAGDLIEHIFDTRAFLRECQRVLVGGGVFVLTTPNLATLQDRCRFLLGKSPRHVDALHSYLALHIRPFTAQSLRTALQHCGFAVQKLTSNEVQWDFTEHHRLSSQVLARIFPQLGKSLIVCAYRK
jgi:hypothetical protein